MDILCLQKPTSSESFQFRTYCRIMEFITRVTRTEKMLQRRRRRHIQSNMCRKTTQRKGAIVFEGG
jgi:hypothetical protein